MLDTDDHCVADTAVRPPCSENPPHPTSLVGQFVRNSFANPGKLVDPMAGSIQRLIVSMHLDSAAAAADEIGKEVRANSVDMHIAVRTSGCMDESTRYLIVRRSAWVEAMDLDAIRQAHVRGDAAAKRVSGEIDRFVTARPPQCAGECFGLLATGRGNTSNNDGRGSASFGLLATGRCEITSRAKALACACGVIE